MEYLKSFFYNHILKCYSWMQQLTSNVQRMVKKVLSNTLEPEILQKIYVSTPEIRPECKVCELHYRPIGTMIFIQEYNLLFPIPKKNVIFILIIYCLKTNSFFLVNSSNLMDTIKTITVLI